MKQRGAEESRPLRRKCERRKADAAAFGGSEACVTAAVAVATSDVTGGLEAGGVGAGG